MGRGRPRKVVVDGNIETQTVGTVEETKVEVKEPLIDKVSVDIPTEKELIKVEPSKEKRKTVLEYLAEFENRKVLEVPKEIMSKYSDMHFVWVLNDDRRITQKEGMGYELVRCPELIAKKLGTKGNKTITDDLVKYGDVVLMMVPIEYYQARQMKVDLDVKRMLRQTVKNTPLHDAAGKTGHNLPVTGSVNQTRN